MPDACCVEEYHLEVASGTRRLFVVGQRSFDMRELVAARGMVPCSLGACFVPVWHAEEEGVAG